MKLTKSDKLILESYKTMIEGLAKYLPNSYELVLHSLENLEESVIAIYNGEHTGRKVGAPITDLALNLVFRYILMQTKPIILLSSPLMAIVVDFKGSPLEFLLK